MGQCVRAGGEGAAWVCACMVKRVCVYVWICASMCVRMYMCMCGRRRWDTGRCVGESVWAVVQTETGRGEVGSRGGGAQGVCMANGREGRIAPACLRLSEGRAGPACLRSLV